MRDADHLSHVVQCVLAGLFQHDEAGGHAPQVPEGLHARGDVAVAVCGSQVTRVSGHMTRDISHYVFIEQSEVMDSGLKQTNIYLEYR